MAAWIAEGRLPGLNALAHGQNVGTEQDREAIALWGVPELDDLSKSGGWPNANSLATLRMYDELGKEDRFLLRHYPAAFVRQAGTAMIAYFRPTSVYFGLDLQAPEELRQHALAAHAWRSVDRLCCISRETPSVEPQVRSTRASLLKLKGVCAGAVVLNALLAVTVFSVLRGRLQTQSRSLRVFILAMTLTILYSFVVSTLLENGENMRFRYETQALVVLVVTLGMWTWKVSRNAGLQRELRTPALEDGVNCTI